MMNVKDWFACGILMAILTAGGAAQAQEANPDLYDAVAPADSAFIRVLNLAPTSVEARLSSKSQSQRIPARQFGAYRFVAPGSHQVSIGETTLTSDFPANTASTLVLRDDQLILIRDEFVNEPRRAQVAFYNFTDKDVALKTVDGKHAVVEAIGKDQTGSRMVNEIKLGFAAYRGEEKVADYDEMLLRKGRSYSYALLPTDDGVHPLSLANTVDASE